MCDADWIVNFLAFSRISSLFASHIPTNISSNTLSIKHKRNILIFSMDMACFCGVILGGDPFVLSLSSIERSILVGGWLAGWLANWLAWCSWQIGNQMIHHFNEL
eukprot:252457_1